MAYCGICELSAGSEDWKGGTPGDYGFRIANGRLAIKAISGMFSQDGLTDSAWGDWALYTASPLRAFVYGLGVQDPVGSREPVGYSADGDLLASKRRRTVELEHGRISKLAAMGYITPEVVGRLPGALSPSKS